jgi:hypothetical protein
MNDPAIEEQIRESARAVVQELRRSNECKGRHGDPCEPVDYEQAELELVKVMTRSVETRLLA